MKISKQGAGHTEIKPRVDEVLSLAFAGFDPAASQSRCMLHCADGGCSDGHNAAFLLHGRIDLLSGFCGDAVSLGMQLMIFHSLGPHRLEGSQADVQSDLSQLDLPASDSL